MKKDYNFYIPEPESLNLYKIDHWDSDTNEFWDQYVSSKNRLINKFKINNDLLKDINFDVMENYALLNEEDSNYPDDMYIFNIGFLKDAIYIYNELTNYYETSEF